MSSLNVEIPKDINKLQNQIKALEWQIEHDANDKDKEIHRKALEGLKAALNELPKLI